jgi:uncharacterized membrane-anchored protein
MEVSHMGATTLQSPATRQLLNKVPEVTVLFWIIKIMATTVGETGADYLNGTLGLGLTGTSLVMFVLLAGALVWQFSRSRYIAPIYWLTVVLVSVVGTLITDNLTDGMGVPLIASTISFAVALIVAFAVWWGVERSLSIHTIFTRRRESFYWLAILLTFALGTAAGDWVSESMGIGYSRGIVLFGGLIAVIASAHYILRAVLGAEHRRLSSNAVLAFWLCYILTRPLGASIGDFLTQPRSAGGIGLGANLVTAIFTVSIIAGVTVLSITKADVTTGAEIEHDLAEQREHQRRHEASSALPAESVTGPV